MQTEKYFVNGAELKTKRDIRIYRNAYNNPGQYDATKVASSTDPKHIHAVNIVSQAITDRRRDDIAGTMKYKF